ncbi:hypothetical protein SDC9_132524 [bioreactor metagenome]|uniref:ChrB N-terminal domain-containing protein n=1 Tax=bioreactor metagenome TaxID=1076179 RepID=A0A645D923_9ZZZZ
MELFNQDRDTEYKELLEKCDDFFREIEKETQGKNFVFAELEENEAEYQKLEEWLNKIMLRDFFNAPLKKQSEEKLGKCKQILNDFSEAIYRKNNEIE